MLTWADIGNGWRNLFLFSCLIQALALGSFFATHRLWVKKSRVGAFLAGVSVTPIVQYLWMLLLALLWPHAPKLVYIGVLPALGLVYLAAAFLPRVKRAKRLLLRLWIWKRHVSKLDRPAVASLCFALALGILLAPICVRTATSTVTAQADAGEYMALGLRYCEDRDLGELLEKDDQTGHFRGHAHFPSMELYMSYGLMHTSDVYGYPYDKPMHTALGLLVFYVLSAFCALLIQVTNGRKRWVLLGLLLFNLVPNYVYSLSGAVRDSWRCLALLMATVALIDLRPDGNWKKYLGKLLFVTALCFTAMSAHVVSFVVLPFIVVAWVILCWARSLLKGDRRAGRTLLRAVGLALGGAVGTLVAYSGNLWCWFKWGEMSPWRLMTTYTDAPWFQAYLTGEYKLEETTTHLNFWRDKYDIVMAYATPVGLWGMRLAVLCVLAALALLICRRVKARRQAALTASHVEQATSAAVSAMDAAATAAVRTAASTDSIAASATASTATAAVRMAASTDSAAASATASTATAAVHTIASTDSAAASASNATPTMDAARNVGNPVISATQQAPITDERANQPKHGCRGLAPAVSHLPFMPALAAGLLALCTLAPMTGLLDTKLYSFSGSFLTMQRYTLQWFLFACGAICAALALLEEEWPLVCRSCGALWEKLVKRERKTKLATRRAPALLCTLLCGLALVQGTRESGYANSFYRYGRPWLTDEFYAQDNSFVERYSLLLRLDAAANDSQKILITRAGYQYALHSRAYCLTANPIVPLLNLPLADVPAALAEMNVAAICTEPDFWDERYFSQSTLAEYLRTLPAAQVLDDGHMRVYLLDPKLAETLGDGGR